MSTADPIELGRRMHDAFNKRDFDAVGEIFAADFYSHPMDAGRDAVRSAWEAMAGMYPEVFTAIDDIFADGDRVALRATVHGMAANGQTATVLEIFRVADGRIAELWGARGIPAGAA
jgi:predicted SnoaL-like aldol condensation-catalyzing enzyme